MLLPSIRFAAISVTDSANPNYFSVPRVTDQQGREEGRARARVEGALVGQIMLLQEQLGVAEFTQNELINFREAQLSEMAAEFKRRLRNRSV